MQPFEIAGMGGYLPERVVTSEELAARIGKSAEWIHRSSGVRERRYAQGQTAAQLGACAARAALRDAGLELGDIDLILAASGTNDQAMPCNAALLQRELGASGTPAFDVNSTCLSFLVALDVSASLLACGRYRTILIASSEVSSVGLDFGDPESAALFGDGAAAAVVRLPAKRGPAILASRMETYSEGAEFCRIRAGGSSFHPRTHPETVLSDHLFHMEGKSLFKLASKKLPAFLADLLAAAKVRVRDIDVVIPHQASRLAIEHLQRKLALPSEKIVNILATHGNQISASIPLALSHARAAGRVGRGALALLIGTSAGISLGGAVLRT